MPELPRASPAFLFRGTRVPIHALFDYLEGGETLAIIERSCEACSAMQ